MSFIVPQNKRTQKVYTYLERSGASISATPTCTICFVNAGSQHGITDDMFRTVCRQYGNIKYILNWPATKVPGLVMVEDFITAEEESALAECLNRYDWELLSRRRVQHHGKRFNYANNRHDEATSINTFPIEVQNIIMSKLQGIPYLIPANTMMSPVCPTPTPDQLTVNEYAPGAGISAHVDTHSPFEGAIISVSLCGRAVMEFKHAYDGRCVSVLVPRRSLMAFTGEARFNWTHGLTETRFDYVNGTFTERKLRISLTFRQTRTGPCECTYPALCDSIRDGSKSLVSPVIQK
eukprot:CFRG5562T1